GLQGPGAWKSTYAFPLLSWEPEFPPRYRRPLDSFSQPRRHRAISTLRQIAKVTERRIVKCHFTNCAQHTEQVKRVKKGLCAKLFRLPGQEKALIAQLCPSRNKAALPVVRCPL